MYKIGFCSEEDACSITAAAPVEPPRSSAPRKSVVLIRFPGNGKALAYYNDRFDLRVGDLVYVDGKLEGIRGRVIEINYNFKIKLSEYKRVISLVDTQVHGTFFAAGSHFVTFDAAALPAEKVRTWFLAPPSEEEEYVSGNDDTAFPLDDLNEMNAAPQIVSRGKDYYADNHVKYLSVDGTRGYAIVQGTEPYEAEFTLCDGMVSNLTCTCFCSYTCKHEVAAMLQLRETLERIGKHYADKHSGYFAAVLKSTLFSVAVDGMETGSFTL